MPFKGFNSVLFDFDCLFDTKLGIINYLKKTYLDGKKYSYINTTELSYDMDYFKVCRIVDLEDVVEKVLLGDAKKDYISLTEQLLSEKYKEILHISPPTSMLTLLRQYGYAADGAISSTVLCKNDIERELCKRYATERTRIIVDEYSKVDTMNYGRIIVGNVYKLLEFDDPTARNFLILNYRENFLAEDPAMLPISIIATLGDTNTFNIADAFIDLPPMEG